MKKASFAIVAVVTLVCLLLAGCGSGEQVWKLARLNMYGEDMSLDEFAELAGSGIDSTEIRLQGSGTFTMASYSPSTGEMSETTGSWAKSDAGYDLTTNGSTLPTTLSEDGKELSIDLGGMIMIFEKE